MDIDSDDSAITKIRLPHPKRFGAHVRLFVAADTDFKYNQRFVFEGLEITLVMLRVPVPSPLVRAEANGETVQVISVPPVP